MPTLLSQLLCALAAAALALTAGLGLLAFAKYYSFIFLGPSRATGARRPRAVPTPGSAAGLLAIVVLFLGPSRPGRSTRSAPACRPLLGFNLARTTISHPLVLGPVFTGFSVLAPTWLYIVLPAYAVIAALIALGAGRGRRRVRRAPGVGDRQRRAIWPPCSTGHRHTRTRCA